MNTTVKCPKCGEEIEISEALRGQIKAEQRIEIEKEIEKKIGEKSRFEIEDLKKVIQEKDAKVDELRDRELELREKTRKLEDKEKELELETQRRIDIERKRVEEEVLKRAYEEHHLKDQENQQKLQQALKMNEELKQKLQQGSQQTQGEVLELDLEETLRSTFPNDVIEPVGKGIRGADIRQIVKSPKGYACGVILWESKRTKAWTDEWLTKLKDDLRAEKANIPVIVSTSLPRELKSSMGLVEGVWVTTYELFIPLATLLRKNLLDIYLQKAISVHKGEKAEELYDFITGHEFRQQVEALVEVYREMSEQIGRERAAYEKIWKMRESQIGRILNSTAGVVGSIQGKIGQSAFPLKGLELLELEEKNK